MLNICPKEFDKTEAAWSLFCLLGHKDLRPCGWGTCVKSRRGQCPSPTSAKTQLKVKLTCVGQVLLMLQWSLEETFSWGCDRQVGQDLLSGKDTEEREPGARGAAVRRDGAVLLHLHASLASPSRLGPSTLSDPSMCWFPPCVNCTKIIFLAIEMHFFYFNSIMILSIKKFIDC